MPESSTTTTPQAGSRRGAAVSGRLRLHLAAVPENVAVVRQALAGVAEALSVDPALAADMKIAVTEACANAVVHAYEGTTGPLEVTMAIEDTQLTIGVRDRGLGFKPPPTVHEGSPLGFGLSLIVSLADAFAIQGGSVGTEVLMSFDLAGDPISRPTVGALDEAEAGPPSAGIAVRMSAGPLVSPVLGHVISLLAARAGFSLDRLSDAQLVSDTLSAHVASHALDGHVALVIEGQHHRLALRIGPLVPGGGGRLVAATGLPGVGQLLERLTDELEVEQLAGEDAGEQLRVALSQPA